MLTGLRFKPRCIRGIPLFVRCFTLTDPFNADRKKQEKDQARAATRITKVTREFDEGVQRLIDEGDKQGLLKMAKALKEIKG